MKHKGLIALAAIFAAGILLTTFTSQILGVKEPVGTVMITNEADTEGVPMAGRAAAQAAIDEDPASQGQKTAQQRKPGWRFMDWMQAQMERQLQVERLAMAPCPGRWHRMRRPGRRWLWKSPLMQMEKRCRFLH